MSTQFYSKQFSLAEISSLNAKKTVNSNHGLALFNPQIGSYQLLPLQARVDLGAMGIKGVLRIPQSSSITGTSPSDCLVLYPGHSLVGVLPLCRGAVGVFYSPSRLDNQRIKIG